MLNSGDVRQKIFRFKYARFGCFMTAMGREFMYEVVKPIKDDIVRIHTDGFISNKRIKGLDIGEDLGQWKLTKGVCMIESACVVRWSKS